jgi:hypothetical protein
MYRVVNSKFQGCVMKSIYRGACLCVVLISAALPALASDSWTTPTPEELKMTSIPEVPGASALYLNLTQTADDHLHMFSNYVRLKVLTEGGKEYANVDLPYFASYDGATVDDIAGRTIAPDGTVTMFTGKPYDKLIAKAGNVKYKTKVFTLPDVQVGSILEYRFKIHYGDEYLINPNWYIQSNLFLRSGHYQWTPTTHEVMSSVDGGDISHSIAWTPLLPAGASVKDALIGGVETISLDIANVPPVAQEEMMPPMDSLSYRVLFYYTAYRTPGEYWKKTGERWSDRTNHFIGPNGKLKSAVEASRVAGETQDQKLRRLYAQLMTMENTDFTHEQTLKEEKAHGLKDATTSWDIYERKRGSGDQLTQLFVAMARASGMKAYVMQVADRSKRLFMTNYLSLSQLDDAIALVEVDGKEVYLDPGQRYCQYGHMAWEHQFASGLRQEEKGTALAQTPGEISSNNHSTRVADLKLDEHGIATGTVTLSYEGNQALSWRQRGLRGDDASVKQDLRSDLEHMLPGGMDVEVKEIKNLDNPEQPLNVTYTVHGAVGTPVGKRLLVPSDLFESSKKALFTQPKREVAIDLHYASYVQDAVRYTLPANFAIESVPDANKEFYLHEAGFTMSNKRAGNSVTFFRNVSMAKVLVMPTEYPEFRTFYNKLESKGQDAMVLTQAAVIAGGTR